MTNQVALVTISDIQFMAKNMAQSGLFGVKNEVQALSLMLLAQAEGTHPAIAARDYDIINGKPAKKTEAMLRDFIGNGGKVQWHELSDTMADATFTHPSGGEVRISWDMERAKAAGLSGKEMWKKFPRQMLRSRLVSEGIRTVCPGATSGMYVPEEVRDFDDDKPAVKNMGSAQVVDDAKQTQDTPTPVQVSAEQAEQNKATYRDRLIEGIKATTNIDSLNVLMTEKLARISKLSQPMQDEIEKAREAQVAIFANTIDNASQATA